MKHRHASLPQSIICSFAAVLGLMGATAAIAQVVPRMADPLKAKVVAPIQFVATVAPEELSQIQASLPTATLATITQFNASAGGNWRFWVDRRSGGMALAEGAGIPWIKGSGNSLPSAGVDGALALDDLASKAWDMMERYPDLFQVSTKQLVLDRKASVNFGEDGQYWAVVYKQSINKIPVDGSRVVFHVSHGNLVQFGVNHTIPFSPTLNTMSPAISVEQARFALSAHLGGFLGGDVFLEEGTLFWAVRGSETGLGYSGVVGSGWEPLMVYRFKFRRPGSVATWEGLVSATNGSILRFVDSNMYASSLVLGSVYKKTNCADPADCKPGSTPEFGVPLPAAKVDFTGGTACSGDGCYTTSAGSFTYPAGAVSATTALLGKYFSINDGCGPLLSAAAAPSNIDLGTTPSNPSGTNTDCVRAIQQSPPGMLPTDGGPGDTHAARNMYYHLNLENSKARIYLPTNEWLKGIDGITAASVPVKTNIPVEPATLICNAFWDGTGLNFLKMLPANPALGFGCNNTGDIPGVALHEYGHGIDQNDAAGNTGELSSAEAMADTFALLEAQVSCMGSGFFLKDPTSAWGNTAGYGSSSATCSGVRDGDYTRNCVHGTAAGCTNPTDPDSKNGSHSGLTPNLTLADDGTPAIWRHMLTNGGADGKSGFYACSVNPSYSGPLGHEGHCESLIASQSNFDLTKKLANSFGGNIYLMSATPGDVVTQKTVSAWQYMDRLWYLTRDIAESAYSVYQDGADLRTNGCAVDNWFSTFRFVDDNDGNLANGTPHGQVIFDAFNLHETACGLGSDASNQSTGLGVTPAAPVLTSCDATKSPVQLRWTASTDATKYRVLRNTLGCEFGMQPIVALPSGRLFYEDAAVAPGVSYYYRVQAVGSNDSTYGIASGCVVAVPAACGPVTTPAPAGLTAAPGASGTIDLSWTAALGANSYKIYRKRGADSETLFPFEAIGVSTTTTYADPSVQGTLKYTYYVASAPLACSACSGAGSAHVEAIAPGTCDLPPTFGGVKTVVSATGPCKITVTWLPGAQGCGATLTYDVFRAKDDPNFVPSAANRIATGVAGTSYADTSVAGVVPHYYIVRAVDSRGVSDTNLIRRSAIVGTRFGGVTSVTAGQAGTCKLSVNWSAYTPGCGTAVTYSIYRSSDPAFVPDASNRIISGLTGGTFTDFSVTGGTRYFYVVRAVEASGATDGNNVRTYEVPIGNLTAGTYKDNAGDTGNALFLGSLTQPENFWSVRLNDTGNATKVYATTGVSRPVYPDMLCEGLESPSITLGAMPALTFRSRYNTEDGWDGGYVEVSTDGGGYTDWQKLLTVDYPGIMQSPSGDPACATVGFKDGQQVFTGTGAWAGYSGSLIQYANTRVRLRFLFSSDPASSGQGWFVDDIAVSDAMIPGPCVTAIGSPQFSAASYTVNEDAGTITITVNRTGGTSGTFQVSYATSDGTATAGSDYTATSGTLLFGDGQASKTFTIPILNDTIVENDETVNITLSNPSNGITLGSPSTALLTIHSDDIAAADPTISSISPNSACQGSGGFTISITGTNFTAASVVRVNGTDRSTTFGDSSHVQAGILASDLSSPGSLSITVINGSVGSNAATLSVNADTAAPAVTAPAAIVIAQSMCTSGSGGASGDTAGALASFLAAGNATDGCSATQRLAPQVNGADVTGATVFRGGSTPVTFRFRDGAGNIGTATSNVTVRLFADLSSDASVDATDLVIMANYLVGNVAAGTAPFNAPLSSADLDRNASVDAVDLVIDLNYFAGNITCLPTH